MATKADLESRLKKRPKLDGDLGYDREIGRAHV